MENTLTVKELAAYLKLRDSTVRRFALQGKLPAVKTGKSWRFEMDKIQMLFPEKKIVVRPDYEI